jgi:hypothetical protein
MFTTGLLLVAATILLPALVKFVVEHEDPRTRKERKRDARGAHARQDKAHRSHVPA